MGRKILEEEDAVRMRGRMLYRTFQAAGEGFLGFRETPVGLPPRGPGGEGGALPMVPPHGSAYGGAQRLRPGGEMGEHRGRDWGQWGVLARRWGDS
eukprot:Cvel_19288.t1-p1 / transcript=Cvel_19288.t1 / gene=Cvel_19288 / organism=Chromera_velia_CCMP2878 / gene_product=hypothetical protein / transcript_product=hypothetical protein / location=Cvel_scaffold1651:38753-39037(+) / protein_length=95 / sequence_SO=supercontig / SO=protein_coding / is_pseudo=false